jgi:IS30 family transposase
MGRRYEQFSLKERYTLSRLSQAGKTVRQIAAAMDRAPSTIGRELKRNSGSQVGYEPAYAEQQAKSRRWKGSRLIRDPSLQALVLKRLGQGWSPAQVAGRLKKEKRGQLSAMKRSIGLSTLRSAAPRTTAGGTICRGGKVSAVGAGPKAPVRWITPRGE